MKAAFNAFEWTNTIKESRVVAAFLVWAIVTGKQYKGVFVQFIFLQFGHDLAHSSV